MPTTHIMIERAYGLLEECMCKDKPYVDLYFATDTYQKVVGAKGIYLNLPFKGCNQAERTDHVTDVNQKIVQSLSPLAMETDVNV